jgi:K+-transporting ATPase ATPase C chain
MKKHLRISFTFTLFFTVLTGIVYPLLSATASSYLPSTHRPCVLFEPQESQDCFHGRPLEKRQEVNGGHPTYVFAASNLSLTNPVLWKQVASRRKVYNEFSAKTLVPRELLFASASGYDPHISVQAALFQLPRIARARSLDVVLLKKFVDQNTQHKLFGFIGADMVNVIVLNRLLADPPRTFAR